jgi:pyruvate ferredoxin oxidoreductase alpha subunit
MQAEAMKAAKARILEVAAEFEKFPAGAMACLKNIRMEDAELALVLIGSTAGTAKAAVDKLREMG